MRICRYYAGAREVERLPHAHVGGLAGEALLRTPRRLVRTIDGLEVEKHGFNLCPFFENGPDFWIYARYRDEPPVQLYSFCGLVTNGHLPLRALFGIEPHLEALTSR